MIFSGDIEFPRDDEWSLVGDSVSTGPRGWSVKAYVLRGGLQEGVSVVEVDNGHFSFLVLPTRGMGIWKGRSGDLNLGWDSPVKRPVHPSFIRPEENGGLGWLRGFNEWVVRCGLSSMGAPVTDTVLDNEGNPSEVFFPLHGNIANLPAHRISLEIHDEEIILRGEVDETIMFGPALRLNVEMRTNMGSGSLTIIDTVTNLGSMPVEHELLYHVNYGEPLLEQGSRFYAPVKEVAPRDPRAAEGIIYFDRFDGPTSGFAEQVYWLELLGETGSRQTLAMLSNAEGNRASLLRYSLHDFPCFTLWKNTADQRDGYVTGLEPATSYPTSRKFERKRGRLISLEGGESRTTKLALETLEAPEAVSSARAEIRKLQETVEMKRHLSPVGKFSDLGD